MAGESYVCTDNEVELLLSIILQYIVHKVPPDGSRSWRLVGEQMNIHLDTCKKKNPARKVRTRTILVLFAIFLLKLKLYRQKREVQNTSFLFTRKQ